MAYKSKIILTEREKDVLKLLYLNEKQIGERLYIAQTTVRSHKVQIYQKLNVHNPAQAIIAALQKRIITIKEIEWNF